MLFWIIVVIGLILVFALNLFGTVTVLSASVNTVTMQRKLIWLIWLIPYFGTMLAMIIINKAIKRSGDQSKDNITSSLKSLGEKFDLMEKQVRGSRRKSSH